MGKPGRVRRTKHGVVVEGSKVGVKVEPPEIATRRAPDTRHEVESGEHRVRVKSPKVGIEVEAPEITATRGTEAKFTQKKVKKLPKW